MKISELKRGQVYNYQLSVELVSVMYTGYNFDPAFGWGYGFRGYNEETGKYDGYFNTLSYKSVENMVSIKEQVSYEKVTKKTSRTDHTRSCERRGK